MELRLQPSDFGSRSVGGVGSLDCPESNASTPKSTARSPLLAARATLAQLAWVDPLHAFARGSGRRARTSSPRVQNVVHGRRAKANRHYRQPHNPDRPGQHSLGVGRERCAHPRPPIRAQPVARPRRPPGAVHDRERRGPGGQIFNHIVTVFHLLRQQHYRRRRAGRRPGHVHVPCAVPADARPQRPPRPHQRGRRSLLFQSRMLPPSQLRAPRSRRTRASEARAPSSSSSA